MAIDLEVTPGASDATAYADVEQAVEVAAYRGPSGAAFLALTADQKAQALATVAADIDAIGDDFIGERATDEQALEWPRTGTDYADDALPRNLVRANIEGAIANAGSFATGATGDVLNPAVSNIKREKVGPLETEYFTPAPTTAATSIERFPTIVQRLLAPLIRTVNASAWGSAEAVRGS